MRILRLPSGREGQARACTAAGKVTAWLLLLAAFTIFGSAPARAQRSPAYKISALKVQLFYEDKGTFSRDVLADKSFALWNVIIGEGSAEGPSNSTLILVEVSGAPGASVPTRKVEFVATVLRAAARGGVPARQVVLAKRTTPTGILNAKGTWYAAFWLYDTGCEPITLSVKIVGQAPSVALQRIIEFRCGE